MYPGTDTVSAGLLQSQCGKIWNREYSSGFFKSFYPSQSFGPVKLLIYFNWSEMIA
jgi:hypothetical protein